MFVQFNRMKNEEERQIRKLKAGDEITFKRLFYLYSDRLFAWANNITRDPMAAADIVQECYAKLWQLREDFIYVQQVKSFLYTTVRNKSLNELEHAKVKSDYVQKVLSMNKESFFHDKMIVEESYRILVDAIEKLPPQMKIIMLLALDGKSNPEIAEELNISKETVHSQKKIAYRKLREFLKDYYYLIAFFI